MSWGAPLEPEAGRLPSRPAGSRALWGACPEPVSGLMAYRERCSSAGTHADGVHRAISVLSPSVRSRRVSVRSRVVRRRLALFSKTCLGDIARLRLFSHKT